MIGPKRKAKKKAAKEAAREAAGKKVEEHLNYSRVKAMQDAEIESERKIAGTMDSRRSSSEDKAGSSGSTGTYEDVRRDAIDHGANAGASTRGAGVVNAMVKYDGRTSGAPVVGGTRRQVKKSQKQALKNSSQGKQARAATKRMYNK
jgi:hypothetical protein